MSTHLAIMEHVRDEILRLGMDGVSAANVAVLKDFDTIEQERIDLGAWPGIAIYHGDDAETFEGPATTNVYETVGFPVQVTCVDRDRNSGRPSQRNLLDHDRYLTWRERIFMRFHAKPLMPSVCYCTMGNRPIWLSLDWRRRSLWKSPLSFIFWARLPREVFIP